MMKAKDILNAVTGRSESGDAKCLVTIATHSIDVNSEGVDPEILAEDSTLDAVVSLVTKGDYTYLDLKFPTSTHEDLAMFYRCLEKYLETAEDVSGTKEYVSFISLLPIELGGEAYINCIYPVFWALEPDVVGEPARNLRVVFFAPDVLFLESDLDDEDLAKMVDVAKAKTVVTRARTLAEEEEEAYQNARNEEFTSFELYDFGDDDDDEENN